MGELLPCPFCGAKPCEDIQNGYIQKADGSFYQHVWCDTCNASGGEFKTAEEAIERWNTRPRTEGRGGEPVASDKALFDALWDLVAAIANEGIPQTPRTKAAFKVAHQAALDRLRKDWSAPIREPEISRTILGDPCTLEACPPGLFIADAYNTLGMKSEYRTEQGAIEAYIVESGEFFWGDNPQTVERQRAQIVRPISHADAILNLAPVGGRGEGSKALADVAAERHRQMEVEGWTPEHDDGHGGDLLTAAVCYAQRRMDEDRFGVFANYAPAAWPWDSSWWKPKDRRRDLIRAAALLVAEIERLDRLPPPPQEQGGVK